jgi:SsrA-binding protein
MTVRDPNYKKVIALNRRAKFEYFIEETLEAGIVLTGPEVKSLRINGANINDSYATVLEGEIYLINSHIKEYKSASKFNYEETRRPRKLLLHTKQMKKLIGLVQKKGQTLVPLSIYFNNKNLVKIELGVVTGKKLHDKRESLKQADWQREKAQILKRGREN